MGKPLTHGCGYDWRVCQTKHASIKDATELRERAIVARLDAMDEALTLRTGELERRLEGLNQLRQEVTQDRKEFLQKETYDIKTAYYDEWCRNVDARLTTLETRIATWVASLGVLFTVVQLILHYWSHK
jgi:uncharacterized protein YydD (DUF2326 family)